ncbi:MAG: protein kinase [Planctomycetes bacterium]|nr:protein kinase [Planctomycetota bacterium]
MSGPSLTGTFLDRLEDSRLLSPEQFAEAMHALDLRRLESPEEIARELVKHKLLTRFQAERLLDGRARGFFIDRYTVLEMLGLGGMGRLYLALDTESGQKVALKVLTERLKTDAGMLARLKIEARAGRKLDHPNIVRTLRCDDTGAICFVAMEFVRGISLFELLVTRGRLPHEQACDVALQAAAGLEHAHSRGIIHRDVKPENLLIDREGHVKLLDFGLALVKDEADSEFSLAMIFGHDCLGTADYIPPEQSLDSQAVDARADIYSLGCTLYCLLTAKFPFPEKTGAAKLEAHRTKLPRPLKDRDPRLPDEVVAVVEKMMAKRPEDRYQSAAEVIAALEPLAQRKPVDFDFSGVLMQRIRQARTRSDLERPSKPKERTSSSTRPRSSIAAGGQSEQAIETAVAGDTRPLSGVRTSDSTFEVDVPLGPPREEFAVPVRPLVSEETAELPPAELRALDGPSVVPLNRGRFVIGRSESCDFVLTQAGVSGTHCELLPEGTFWRIHDLNSKNGVEVNGVPVTDRMLWPGDVVTIARRQRFRIVDPTAGELHRAWYAHAWLWAAAAALAGAAGAAWAAFGS